jgi:integrase
MTTYPRGSGFETKFMVAGVRYSGHHATREDGEAWELESRARIKKGLPVIPAEDTPTGSRAGKVKDLEALVEHCRKIRWSSTRHGASALKNAELFRDWAGPKLSLLDAFTPAKIDEYVLWRQTEKRNSGPTLNRHISAVSVLRTMARKFDNRIPLFDLPWQPERPGRLRFYTPEEETEILGTLLTWGLPEFADLFIFLVDTGARLEEAETYARRGGDTFPKLLWSDIRGNAITFEDTKTGFPRTVYGTDRVMGVLKRMKARPDTPHGPFEWVRRRRLRTVWDRLRGNIEWMGRDTVIHTFRHTCASRLVQRGVDLYRVMKWMGHKNINTTMRYAKLRPLDMEALASVLANHTQKEPRPCPPSLEPSLPSSFFSGVYTLSGDIPVGFGSWGLPSPSTPSSSSQPFLPCE